MKNILLTLLLVMGPALTNAQTALPADSCQDKFTYLQSIIKLNQTELSCPDIIVAAKNLVDKKPRTKIKGFEFHTKQLQTLNTNPLICGRTDYNLKATDRWGRPVTVDIGTDTVVKAEPIEKGILLPYMPESLVDDENLKTLFSNYISSEDDAFDKDLSKMYAKHVQVLKKSRAAVLSGLFKSIKSDEACSNRLCYEFDKDNIKSCLKELNGNNAYSYIEQKVAEGHTQLPSLIKQVSPEERQPESSTRPPVEHKKAATNR